MIDDTLATCVRDAWWNALGRTDVGGGENFFVIGGHSMLGIRMMAALSTAVGKRLPIRLLFNNPTLDELTQAVAVALAPQGSE